jgi:hypothetical protein
MSATEKNVNFTAEQTASIRAAYMAAVQSGADYEARSVVVKQLADDLGKSVRSVQAKLSREGVYLKKEYVAKTGEPVASREDIATAIMEFVGMSDAEAESLAKANKTALSKLAKALGIVSVSVAPKAPRKVVSKVTEVPDVGEAMV